MVKHGDPNRRGTDQSESDGAAIKDTIHRRCLRRKKGARAEKAPLEGAKMARRRHGCSDLCVMQTYRDMSVRERLLRDEVSKAYLLRHHFTLASSGFTTVGEAAECSAANLSNSSQKRDNHAAVHCALRVIQPIVTSNLTVTNLTATNLTIPNLTVTNLTATNLTVTNLTVTNLTATNLTVTNLTATNLARVTAYKPVNRSGCRELHYWQCIELSDTEQRGLPLGRRRGRDVYPTTDIFRR
ncbi:hypothetical protein AB1Y20_005672 [Prymnesium parvum]|uniref:Uncharacterized protein n=1 Tax=Prymnesium parvum TaxID=97485 RepID=A0AB34J5E8_PRYPA